ncbi:hypothetical protein Bca101_005167 [Brassica carinata]
MVPRPRVQGQRKESYSLRRYELTYFSGNSKNHCVMIDDTLLHQMVSCRSCVWLKWRSSMPPQWPLAKSLRFKSSFRDSWLFWFSKGDSLRLGLCPGSSYCLYTRRVLAARVFVCRFSTTSGFVAAIAAWSSLTSQHHLSLLELSVGVCDKLCADSGFQAKEYGGYGSFLARRDLGTCSFRV